MPIQFREQLFQMQIQPAQIDRVAATDHERDNQIVTQCYVIKGIESAGEVAFRDTKVSLDGSR